MDERVVALLKELNGKMRELKTAVCCQTGGGGGGTIPTIAAFQPQDCDGDAGSPLDVVPTAVQNVVNTTLAVLLDSTVILLLITELAV